MSDNVKFAYFSAYFNERILIDWSATVYHIWHFLSMLSLIHIPDRYLGLEVSAWPCPARSMKSYPGSLCSMEWGSSLSLLPVDPCVLGGRPVRVEWTSVDAAIALQISYSHILL